MDENTKELDIAAIIGLVLFTFAGFATSLYVIPSLTDDIFIFSSVLRNSNPLVYFVGDWGTGTNFYRPLLSLSFWFCYKFFGLNAFVNQGMSIVSHALVAVLVYRIIRLYQSDVLFSFLISSLVIFSLYTGTTVPMATDRCTLFAAIFILILFHHLVSNEQKGQLPHLGLVVGLSVLAVMSKESGLIAPALGAAHYFRNRAQGKKAWTGVAVLVVVALGYVVFRYLIFRNTAFSYASAQAESQINLLTLATSMAQNLLAPFFPVKRWLALIPTVALWALLLRRPFNSAQKLALWFIFFSALVHPVHYFRLMYLGHVAFCLLIGCSNQKLNWSRPVALVLLVYSVYWTTGSVKNVYLWRLQMMHRDGLKNVTEEARQSHIDPRIVQELRDRYPF